MAGTVDVLIGGWSPGGGRRTGTIGSLVVGVTTSDGLAHIGNVGTGFTDVALRDLLGHFQSLELPSSPFDAVPAPHEFARSARSVQPKLGGEVAYARTRGRSRAAAGKAGHAG